MKCIYFDREGQILHTHGFDSTPTREQIIAAMARSDRADLSRFCRLEFEKDSPCAQYRIYPLKGFVEGKFFFLEKGTLPGQADGCVNIAYFAHQVADFYPLFSPTAIHYRSVTGRCLYELLLASEQKTNAVPTQLTPSAFLFLNQIPALQEELLRDPRLPENCDLVKATDLVIRALSSLPTFAKTEIAFSAVDTEDLIAPISVSGYVFLLTALLHLLHGLSADHRIVFAAERVEDHFALSFTLQVHESRLQDTESRTLRPLGELVPSMKDLAELASVVAFDAGMETELTADASTGMLKSRILLPASATQPVFHYRDPYATLSEMAMQFYQFIESFGQSA